MKKQLAFLSFIFLAANVFCQQTDSSSNVLKEVKVKTQINTVERLPALSGTRIWSGKKTEVLNMQSIDANIAERTPRQIFAKVPGVFVYDMDGSGNQINISVRGLDPHRGWEFNIRKNGVLTNSDMYGYPASHYSMPMEAVDRIELVRGTGSLQYGAQFGGMLNYVTREADTTKKLNFETINSAGSFGLLSTYNAVSGRIGKVDYYAYYSKRVSDGYRVNSKTDYEAQAFMLRYNMSDNIKLKAELARSNYVYQIPGPLTDSMFYADPRQSTRSRNYFNPDIYVPSANLEWNITGRTKLSVTAAAVLGARNSVQFDKPADIKDIINTQTLQYNTRQVDMDHFNSYTLDASVLHQYRLFNREHALTAGVQLFNNDLHRQQQGKGTTGSDFDLTLVDSKWGRDLHFKTKNIALFIENNFRLSNKLTVSQGIRWEHGHSDMSSYISYYGEDDLPNTIKHDFALLGLNTQYQVNKNSNFYAGFAQSYRPVIFKDIIPASLYEVADKNLKDAYGYTVEAGYRGNIKGFKWDVSVFHLEYKNRLGSLNMQNDTGAYILYRTNIGNSRTNGVELFAEYAFNLTNKIYLSVFTSSAYMDARYINALVKSGNTNVNIDGNKVESTPEFISRNGLTAKFFDASVSVLYSYTAKSYADALNTVKPSYNGTVGLVPAYGLLDLNTSYRFNERFMLRLNINNILNKQYFTKRPTFYPGPGIWSSDGRSVNVSVGIKI
ncbi:TonB-dependent receptor [soil metagenome]